MAATVIMARKELRNGRTTGVFALRDQDRGVSPTAAAGMTRAAFLAQVSMFATLSAEARQTVAEACRTKRFRPGEVLFHEGDPAHTFYILRTGQVKIVRVAPDGSETILHVFGPSECLGELALLDDGDRSATAVAMGPVEAMGFYREDFLALVERYPGVALALMARLAGVVRQLNTQVQDLVRLDIRGRLARCLLELADHYGEATPQGLRIALRLTQQELAQMVGAARSNVNLYLGRFQEERVLTTERGHILIHKPQELRKWLS